MSPFSVWADRRETRSYFAELMSEMVNVEEKSWESAIEKKKKFYLLLFLSFFFFFKKKNRFDDFFFSFLEGEFVVVVWQVYSNLKYLTTVN